MILTRIREILSSLQNCGTTPQQFVLISELVALFSFSKLAREVMDDFPGGIDLRENKEKEKNQKKEKGVIELKGTRDSEDSGTRVPEDSSTSTRVYMRNVAETILVEFNEFWAIYPRRQAKGGAFKAFKKARKRAEVADIIAGVKRYAIARKGQDKQFTCLASTWLNEDRWLDEPDNVIEFPGNYSQPKRTWAEQKAEVMARMLARAPVEGEDLDALVRGDDEIEEGGTGPKELAGAGLQNILPTLQAMDHTEED